MRLIFTRILPVIVIAIVAFFGFVKWQYGTGRVYPDLGAATASRAKTAEKLIQLDYPPGNIAVAANGHVYYNYHPIARAQRFNDATVFEWADGKAVPFPSAEAQKDFQGVFGMTIDHQDRIWFIEPASFDHPHTRLWAFDLSTRQKAVFYEFPTGVAQFAEDVRVTSDGLHVILPNPGIFRFTASQLIVFDVATEQTRVVLAGQPCTEAEDWIIQTRYGPHRLAYGLLNFAVGIDGIEISEDQKWVYLAPMTNSKLCRVPLPAVLDQKLTPNDVAKQVEVLGDKPMSDGITIDHEGKVIVTDVEHGGLMSFDPESKSLQTLSRSTDIVWPDGVVEGPDKYLYFTDSAIPAYIDQFDGPPSQSTLLAHIPYFIYRVAH